MTDPTPPRPDVRAVLAKHDPALLALADRLRSRFGARLVALDVPVAGLRLRAKRIPGAHGDRVQEPPL